MTLFGGGAGRPRIIGLAQVDDYNSANFDLGSSQEGDFNLYRLTDDGAGTNYYAGFTTITNNATASPVMYYRQTAGPAKRTGIRVYHETIQMFSGSGLTVSTNIADFTSSLITLIPPVSFTEQLTLPDTPTATGYLAGLMTIDFLGRSTGIFSTNLGSDMTSIDFTNGRVGGQYVIYVTATGGNWTIAVSLLGPPNKTNYTTAISVTLDTTALLTVTFDGTYYLIAGSAYN